VNEATWVRIPSIRIDSIGPYGGTGRRGGLKIHCPRGRSGSSPDKGTLIIFRLLTVKHGKHLKRRGLSWVM
jgi:hypothetical protein